MIARVAAALLTALIVVGVPAPAFGAVGPSAAAQAAPAADGGPTREVLGFLPYWELGDADTALAWDTLTEVAYFGVEVGADGRLVRSGPGWTGWTSAALTTLRDQAHANGVRLTLTVTRMGWSSAGATATKTLLGSATARARAAAQIADEVVARGADGVNLDVEPIPSGSAAGFVALVHAVRAALDARGSDLALTFDATGFATNYDLAGALAPGGADAVVLMGYDFRTAGSATTGSIAPMTRSGYDINEALDAFLAAGVAPQQLLLGVPYYGRVWTTATDTAHEAPLPKPPGGPSDWSSTVLYEEAVDLAAEHGRRYDSEEQSPWTTYPKTWSSHPAIGEVTRQLWFDDAESLAAKYGQVLTRDLRGVAIWALGYDGTRPELSALLRETFDVPRLGATLGSAVAGVAPGGDLRTFAPDGDGRIDVMRYTWSASEAATGRLRIVRSGRTIRSWAISGTGGTVDWTGRESDGDRAAVGRYSVALELRTADGRPARVTTTTTLLRTAGFPRVAKPAARSRAYSVTIRTTSTVRLRVMNAAGVVVRTAYTRRTAYPGTLRWTWDGRDRDGRRVPAGRYRFVLDATTSVGRETLAIATTLP